MNDRRRGDERVILADCCEDWIIEWGGYYKAERAFRCPECGTEWTKSAADTYRRADGRTFQRRTRVGPQASFPYLASVDGHQPNVERCCAKILLAHGERMPEGAFVCPVCGTAWQKSTERLHGLRIAIFAKPGLAEPLTIQPGRTRPFLVALSEYSPPRE
ncbi:MAG TPA: hypothetical protein VFV20_03920 [Candidatus Limnocylindria bacterium]|nr:hypothetical protein [Candidatus Limnocylindria bacterium]